MCDSGGEAGGCFGQVSLEPHLAFQVGEDALDYEPGGGECALRPLLAAVRVRSGVSRRDVVGREPGLVAATPEALVGDHDLGRGTGQQVGERLVLLLVGGDDRVAERQAAFVGEQDEPDTPDEAVLRLRVAVARKAGELGSLLTARITGDRELGAVRSRTPPASSQRASCCCTSEISPTSASQAPVVLRLGQAGAETSPATPTPTSPRNWRSDRHTHRRLADGKRNHLRVAHLRPGGPAEQGPILVSEDIALQSRGLPDRSSSRASISRDTSGSPPSLPIQRVPARNPPFHIKPLVPEDATNRRARRAL